MIKYISHLFSWKAEAGRLEFLGIAFLYTFGNIAALAILAYIITILGALFFGKQFAPDEIVDKSLIYFSIPATIYFCLAAARRCRHIGISAYWALLLLIAIYAPQQLITIPLLIVFFTVCPPIKNKEPKPHLPSYLLVNSCITIALLLIWFICVVFTSAINKHNNSTAQAAVSTKTNITAPAPTPQETPMHTFNVKPYRGPKTIEEFIPVGTDLSLVHPYTGQNIPAVSIGHIVHDNPGYHYEWSFPLPDTTPQAERITWNSNKINSCGAQCKIMHSVDDNHFLRIEFVNNEKPFWSQQLADKKEVKEIISFEAPSRKPFRMMRLEADQVIQDFISTEKAESFMDRSFATHPLFSHFNDDKKGGEVFFLIEPDGSFYPRRILKHPTPDEKVIHYYPDHFNAPWPGLHPSTQYLDFMFPAK